MGELLTVGTVFSSHEVELALVNLYLLLLVFDEREDDVGFVARLTSGRQSNLHGGRQ